MDRCGLHCGCDVTFSLLNPGAHHKASGSWDNFAAKAGLFNQPTNKVRRKYSCEQTGESYFKLDEQIDGGSF